MCVCVCVCVLVRVSEATRGAGFFQTGIGRGGGAGRYCLRTNAIVFAIIYRVIGRCTLVANVDNVPV